MIEVFLYGGILLITSIFISFIVSELNQRKLDKKSKQLTPSFNKGNVLIMKKKKQKGG